MYSKPNKRTANRATFFRRVSQNDNPGC